MEKKTYKKVENISNIQQNKESRAQASSVSSKTSENKDNENIKLIAIIRISGMVKVKPEIVNTLDRLRLRRKYACVLVDGNKKDVKGMLEKVKFYVAYGVIGKDVLVKLIKERGQVVEKGKKPDSKEVADGLLKGKKLSDFKLKSFFRLHPPRKGIKSKLQYPKGVLGNNKDNINKLIERML